MAKIPAETLIDSALDYVIRAEGIIMRQVERDLMLARRAVLDMGTEAFELRSQLATLGPAAHAAVAFVLAVTAGRSGTYATPTYAHLDGLGTSEMIKRRWDYLVAMVAGVKLAGE